MRIRTAFVFAITAAALGLAVSITRATETENLGIRALPAPGTVIVDGKFDDWDLTGGVFVCGDVENQREHLAVWMHAMYDADNLYLLARFLDDTPMNNPGQTVADYGFAGDCLQFRLITHPDADADERTSHWTCWRGRDGDDVMDVAYGKKFDGGAIKDARAKGARQAFLKNADGKGYSQELSIPWALLLKDGLRPPAAGQRIALTVEPNFTIGMNGRVSLKDIFKAGVTPDRVFTFMTSACWGYASFEPAGKLKPQPLRLSDGRVFPVSMIDGVPTIDWNGLIKSNELTGFKTIAFDMPDDGYVSLNIKNADGVVVRQLLSSAFYSKGRHAVKWDGLTTLNWRTPGDPVPAGDYTWQAIWHKGIGLKFVGWAANSGTAPWDSDPTSNWGGDHGLPVDCASDESHIYLAWSAAEAGKALLACDFKGNVIWKNIRAGISGVNRTATDGATVYAQTPDGDLYRLDAKTGAYTKWAGSDSSDIFIKDLWSKAPAAKGPASASAMAVGGGKLFLGFADENLVLVVDASTGKELKRLSVSTPRDLKISARGELLALVAGKTIVGVDPETGQTRPVLAGLENASAFATDPKGNLYVAERDPVNQIKVFDASGKPLGAIGRAGGRATLGKWTPDGMAFVSGVTVAADGNVWAAENDMSPKRFSCWNADGKLVKEFFGPATYGALGGAIDPLDPRVMVGLGCEWRLDSKTGRAACQGVITRDGMQNSRFGVGANGKLYLAVATEWAFEVGPVGIFERLGDGDYKLRTVVSYLDKDGNDIAPPGQGKKGVAAKTAIWCDANGDGQRQPEEITVVDRVIRLSGWYMGMTQDMTFYTPQGAFKVAGFTACGAPRYDLANPIKLPIDGMGSADGTMVMRQGEYGVNNGWNRCFDIASGKLLWTYPDNFVGVHGSHNAVPPQDGMIRGSYGPCGVAKLPKPIGNIWVIATNVGEWHILTEDGFYLTRLFQGDPMKIRWPQTPLPGVSLDNSPCGMGGEDFGGSIACTPDGKLYLQAGKTGFWNVEVTGLDQVKAIKGQTISISTAEVAQAQGLHDTQLQAVVGTPSLSVKKATPTFTGSLETDFKGADVLTYKKQEEAQVRSAAAWDDQNLYVAWEVRDNTPWVNSATEAAQMYIGGDTVDLQLGVDPKADPARAEAVAGDLRISIGNFKGESAKPNTATAVIYRKVSSTRKPMTFSSGVVKSYPMDFVDVLASARIEVKLNGASGYTVEAAIPLSTLDLKPADGLAIRGDFGATHGDPGGRTRLRTYWSNQHTGIVDDAVFELQMEPKNWGMITFK